MSVRRETHNEFGIKCKVQIKVAGKLLDRQFRNRGEAIKYLQKHLDMTRDEIHREVTFIQS